MPYIDASQWNNFLHRIQTAEKQLHHPECLWYRGVTETSHTLLPSLLRRLGGTAKEQELFQKYRALARSIQQPPLSDWETLFEMQHYGIPTRLLDWTEVLGVAVFFALLGNAATDSAVYVLDPLALNLQASKTDIPHVYEQEDFDYRTIYWEHKPVPPVFPIAIEAPAQNSRIAAQRGKFTIHGTNNQPIEMQFPNLVKKVHFPPAARDGARQFLQRAGINEFSIFPDIVGLAPFLEALVGLR